MFRLLIASFIFLSLSALAQSGAGSQVLSRIEKKKWDKAEQVIAKTLAKDNKDVEVKYAASLLFFNKEYPNHHLDTAYRYALAAITDFARLSDRDKEKLKKFPIDSAVLSEQKKIVENGAFGFAKSVNTEESYHAFITHYPGASQAGAARELRDEVAFFEALKINTYTSFEVFLEKYPSSHRSADAQRRHDKLLYDDRTRDGRLKSYEDFVREFPSNPYTDLAEQQILQITTANGSAQAFRDFIKKYPNSKWLDQARNLLFHLDHDAQMSKEEMTDSLRKADELNKLYWVPFLKGDRFGFMDAEGKERIAPAFDDVLDEYLCGNIRSDYLVTSQGIISRSGKLLFEGAVKEVEDLGDGFLKVSAAHELFVLHKSGAAIHIDGLQDAAVIAGRFIAVRKESGWGIVSFTGKIVLPFVYEEISSLDEWIILVKNSKKRVVTASHLGEVADKVSLSEALVFDDVKRWSENLCWVKNGSLEGVLNTALQFVIPFERQTLTKTSFGFIRTKNDQQFIEGIAEFSNVPFHQVTIQGQWMAARQSMRGSLQLIDIASGKSVVQNADSIWFEKNIAMVRESDSVRAWLNRRTHLDFNVSEKTTLFGKDSAAWLVVTEKNRKTVYNALSGQRLFTGDFDQIENLGEGLFLLTKANKKGVVDSKGKVILPIEYDAIIQSEPGRLSLLKEKRFGLYDMFSKRWIRPMYERNVVQYNSRWFTAYKDGGWGFIDADSKPVGKFQFNEIQFWNDSAAWVKENFQWKIYDIQSGKVLYDKIKDFHYVKRYPHEYVAIIHQDNYYGVISNRSGLVIPSTFTDIVNIGDADKPMYFTEKHVEEADISVVIYYSHTGKVLRRQAFESADEYERIYCNKK